MISEERQHIVTVGLVVVVRTTVEYPSVAATVLGHDITILFLAFLASSSEADADVLIIVS